MGQELNCTLSINGRDSIGKVLLETDEVIFRGEFRQRFALKSILNARSEDGRLILETPVGVAVFQLGAQAEKWAERIRNPRTLMDKLGVKPGQAVLVFGVTEPGFREQLVSRGVELLSESNELADLIFFQADEPTALDQIAVLKQRLQQTGAIWVATPRGRPEIADVVVMAAGKSADLVDTKVCRFSETHTALKFVIPVKERR